MTKNAQLLKFNPSMQTLAKYFNMLESPKSLVGSSIPYALSRFAKSGDTYTETIYIDGVRYSTNSSAKSSDNNVMFMFKGSVQFGRISGFLVNPISNPSVVISPFIINDSHLVSLSKRLVQHGMSMTDTQLTLDCLNKSDIGAKITGVSDLICIEASQLIGHSIVISNSSCTVVLPFSYRCMLS
uniref:Uncharacterized protein n=1 Tax=Caenorhabditis japonica TaxID=281687 RepID=A0A8R1E0W1_CAEJA